MNIYTNIYIYIYRERERVRRNTGLCFFVLNYLFSYFLWYFAYLIVLG